MTTQILETRTLVSNNRGEPILWLETLDDGTTTINDSGMGIPLTPEELDDLPGQVRQWLDATGGTDEGNITIHVS